MFITQLLDDFNRDALIDLFGLSAVLNVEAALKEKSGKPYVQCLARKKDIQAKRGELVRQLWLHRRVGEYKSPLSRITVEYPITFGRDTSKRADIVVVDPDHADKASRISRMFSTLPRVQTRPAHPDFPPDGRAR
ncbi:MAG TPA: type I restriction enzyme HsdR N-terminal domain-containing protein [Thiobacillaceae bacterium]|nr:type I restriction enzyme HsdR N-terminal domain-containing protein [Thiobacillaceae bacterium]